MLKLKSITLRNWLRVREAKVDFPDSGIVVVLGQNQTQVGLLESVGSGKTALGEAISRTLLGVPGRYTDFGHYSLNGEGDTYIKVEATLGARKLVVESGFRCAEFSGTGAGLRFQLDDQDPIEHPRLQNTRRELAEIIGLDPEVAPWTVFLDGEQLKFNKLSQAEALALLMQALNQPPWKIFHERALKKSALEATKVTLARASVDKELAAREELAQRLKTLQEDLKLEEAEYKTAVAAHEEALARADQQIEQVEKAFTAASERVKEIQTSLKKAQEADAEEFGRLELERVRTLSDRATAERTLLAWRDEVFTRRSTHNALVERLKTLESAKTCPTCNKPMDKAHPDTIQAARTKADRTRKELMAGQASLTECEKYVGDVRADLDAISQEQARLRSNKVDKLSESLSVADEDRRRADRGLRTAQDARRDLRAPSDHRLVQLRAVLTEVQAQGKTAASRIDASTLTLTEAEHQYRIAAYWVKGFSPAGIPNLVLRRTVDPLNDVAQLISSTLTGGTLSIQFSAETELASGEVTPKLITRVTNRFGASTVQGNSKGEGGLINLIIVETQAQVGRVLGRVGYRWFDEAVNSQDAVVRRNFYGYLREQARLRGVLTFIVDHHSEAANFADHTLIARKGEDGFTTYHWK